MGQSATLCAPIRLILRDLVPEASDPAAFQAAVSPAIQDSWVRLEDLAVTSQR
jgi:hypothetical protein